MEISGRKKLILKAVIEDYVASAEPVSSKALQGRLDLGVSSATIRNEMSELTELGLLEQPHTSAGRVPTATGYRVYVNELMGQGDVSREEAAEIQQGFDAPSAGFEQMVADASKLTNKLTALPSYAMQTAHGAVTAQRFELVYVDDHTFIIVVLLSNKSVQNRLVTLPTTTKAETLTKLAALFNASFTGLAEPELTVERIAATERAAGDVNGVTAVIAGFVIEILMQTKAKRTVVSGATSLLGHPEFHDVERARRVLGYLANEQELLRLPAPDSDGVKIMIGPENLAEELRDSSVVVAKYDAGDNMQGIIGVVGPTRMDYGKVAARLSYIASGLANMLAMGSTLGSGEIAGGDLDE
ncbi:MAG: heat-inducible transcriptional repressor HrcA [Oscillospiraceae bacterium]|nr:heat-inducible transcriptional repressor HrcA [Oscillospiraceae bacterium]